MDIDSITDKTGSLPVRELDSQNEIDSVQKIEAQLRDLALRSPVELEIDLTLTRLAKSYKVGKKHLRTRYGQISEQLEIERRPAAHEVISPTEEQIQKQKADEAARQEWQIAVNARAQKIAESSDIIGVFQDFLLNVQGFITDRNTAGTILVSHAARLLSKSSGFLAEGASASGKTDLIDKAADALPQEDVIRATSCSDQVLFYMGDLGHKYIVGGEMKLLKPGEDDPWQQAFRQFISDNRIVRWVTEKDDTGANVAVKKEARGPASFMLTTTAAANSFNDEFINRLSVFRTDDSEELTAQVLAQQAKRAAKIPQGDSKLNAEIEVEAWRHFHRNLQKLEVAIPYATHIIPRSRNITVRRLFPLILHYVSALALLHQATRTRDDQAGSIQASEDDYRNAYILITKNLPRVDDPISDRARKFFERLHRAFGKSEFTRAKVQRELKISRPQTSRFLKELKDADVLALDSKTGNAFTYKIVVDEIPSSHDFGLVDPGSLIVSSSQSSQNGAETINRHPVLDFGEPSHRLSEIGAPEINTHTVIEV